MITTMYDTATIFRREFVARRALLWAAVYIAVLIAVVPLAPFISAIERADVRDLMSVGSVLGAALALSIGLGATFFGRDLSEGRLGFYFERPVRSVAVWLGRFLALLTVVVLFEVLILLPAKLSSGDGLMIMAYVGWPKSFGVTGWVIALVAGPALLLLLAHAVSVMVRARTAWLVLDLVGAVVAPTIAWLALRPLVEGGFDRAIQVVGLGLVAGVLTALLVAGMTGLSQGRTDLRRTHCFLSTTLWGVLIATLGGLLAYSTWLMTFAPSDFDHVLVGHVSPQGDWVEVEGGSKGHLDVHRGFLVSTDGRHNLPLPLVTDGRGRSLSTVRVSEDGTRAVWLKPLGSDGPATLWHADLQSAMPEPVSTTITLPVDPRLEISPDGTTVAFLDERTLSVFDLREERLLTLVRMEDDDRYLLFRYTNPTNLRLVTITYEQVDDYEWDRILRFSDLAAEKAAKPLTRNTIYEPHNQYFRIDRGLEYVVPGFDDSSYPRRALHLPQKIFRASSGEIVKEVNGVFGGFLPGDRFWSVYLTNEGSARLMVEPLQGEGHPSEVDLGSLPESIVVGGHFNDVIIFASHEGYQGGSRNVTWEDIEVLDIESGELKPIDRALEIVGLRDTYVEFPGGERTSFFETSLSTTLFRDQRGALLVYDPDVNHLRQIAGSDQE